MSSHILHYHSQGLKESERYTAKACQKDNAVGPVPATTSL